MSEKFSLDHIGIAVNSIEEGQAFYKAIGFVNICEEVVESEQVKVGMMELANGARIELIEPTSESSSISKFLKTKGPGIHHYCLRVPDIHQVMADLEVQGIPLIYKKPQNGAHNCLVNFIHPKYTGGVLIEVSEKLKE